MTRVGSERVFRSTSTKPQPFRNHDLTMFGDEGGAGERVTEVVEKVMIAHSLKVQRGSDSGPELQPDAQHLSETADNLVMNELTYESQKLVHRCTELVQIML